MNLPTNELEAKNAPIPWLKAILLSIALWLIFGTAPLFVDWLGLIDSKRWQHLGSIGEMFGAANALFAGLALLAVAITLRQQQHALSLQHRELELTRREIKEATKAQQEIVQYQNRTVSLQVVLPLMDEIGSEDMRNAIIQISDFKRHHGGDSQFAECYARLLEKRRSNTLSNAEQAELDEIDRARRHFVILFHKLHRLSKAGVISDDIVKVVIGPDDVDLLLETVEKLEAKIRANYSREIFDLARRLYTDDERREEGRHLVEH